jgi:hypothetical protein
VPLRGLWYGRSMSFLTDPPALFASGEAYARLAPESGQGGLERVFGGLTVAGFVLGSLAFYTELPGANAIARRLGTRSGRDLMINSWIADFEYKRPRGRVHALAALMFALYPLWWWLGWDHGRRARPRARPR